MPTKLTLEEQQQLTTISYIPMDKNILFEEYKDPKNNILVPAKDLNKDPNKIKLIDPNQISNKDLKDLGLLTKQAMIQNQDTEDQASFVIVAIGPKVDRSELNVGDRVYLKQAAQPTGLYINEKFYGQLESFWVLGRLI